MILKDCTPVSVVPDKKLPLPGLISLMIWVIIVVVVKLVMGKIYAPYSLLFVSTVIELVITIAVLSTVDALPTVVSRLLASTTLTYRISIKILLIVSLLLNYISNIFYIAIFIKYIKKFIPNPK